MTSKFKVDTRDTSRDEHSDNAVCAADRRYKICYVDADTFVVRCAKMMQEDYVEVLHKPSGRRKEFRNKTDFGTRGGKIIENGWLYKQNTAREELGLEPFPIEDFEIESKARLNPEYKSFEEALETTQLVFASHIKSIKREMESEDYILCISSGNGNYREQESRTIGYKSKRGEKPIYFLEFKEAISKTYRNKILWTDNNEAEDYLQHIAKQQEAKFGQDRSKWEVCCCYVDKDCNQIYITHKNYDKYDLGWIEYDKISCEMSLVAQCIAGDPTDTIEGLPTLTESVTKQFGLRKSNGVSKTTAEKILYSCDTIQEMWRRAIFCYQQYYGFNKVYRFKDVHAEDQEWGWLDYMQQCYVLVKMQEYQGQVPNIREYFDQIGVDYHIPVSYGKPTVDIDNLLDKVATCNSTCSELTGCLSKYKSLSKPELLLKIEEATKILGELKGNLGLLTT